MEKNMINLCISDFFQVKIDVLVNMLGEIETRKEISGTGKKEFAKFIHKPYGKPNLIETVDGKDFERDIVHNF